MYTEQSSIYDIIVATGSLEEAVSQGYPACLPGPGPLSK